MFVLCAGGQNLGAKGNKHAASTASAIATRSSKLATQASSAAANTGWASTIEYMKQTHNSAARNHEGASLLLMSVGAIEEAQKHSALAVQHREIVASRKL